MMVALPCRTSLTAGMGPAKLRPRTDFVWARIAQAGDGSKRCLGSGASGAIGGANLIPRTSLYRGHTARPYPQLLDHRPYRPWQVDAGGSADPAHRRPLRS